MVDFVRSLDTKTGFPAGIYLNTGAGFRYETQDSPLSGSQLIQFVNLNNNPLERSYRDNGYRLADINGDGLLDVFGAYQSNGDAVYNGLFLNTGSNGFRSPGYTYSQSYAPPSGFVTSYGFDMGTRLLDMNGDTLPDLITEYATDDNLASAELKRKIYLNTGNPEVDLLKTVKNNYNGEITFRYKPSTAYRENNGITLLNKLPFPVLTVSEVEYSDPVAQTTYKETYEYRDGHFYYDTPYHKGFAGFGESKRTAPDGHFTKYFYHQSEKSLDKTAFGKFEDHFSKQGRLFREEQYTSAGKKLTQSINKWEKREEGAGRFFVFLASVLNQTFEGTTGHRDTGVSYLYDEYGNMVKKTEYGEVLGNDNGTLEDTGDDTVVTEITYAINLDKNLIRYPKESFLKDSQGILLKRTKFFYDGLAFGNIEQGNPTKQILFNDTEEIATETIYDTYGNPTAKTDAMGNVTTVGYDATNTYPVKLTNAKCFQKSYLYNLLGNITQTTDENGVSTQYRYDALGRLTETLVPDPANVTQYQTISKKTYNFSATPVSITESAYNASHPDTFQKTVSYLDGFGRTLQKKTEHDTNQYIAVDQYYGSNGEISKKSLPYFTASSSFSQDATKPSISYKYDALKRSVSETTPLGETKTEYHVWKITTTNPEGQKKESESDAYGRTISSKEFLNTTPYETRYGYDLLGNFIRITDAMGNHRVFSYDTIGRIISATEWHRDGAGNPPKWVYSYDLNGNPLSQLDPKGQKIVTTYDQLNRLVTTKTYIPQGESFTEEETLSYTYDDTTQGNYGKNRLTKVTKSQVDSASYLYDPLGRVTTETRSIGAETFSTQPAYDIVGRLLSLTYPDTTKAVYEYTLGGDVKTVKFQKTDGTTEDIVTSVSYTPLKQIASLTYGNGTKTENTFDPQKLYRLTTKQTTNSSSAASEASLQSFQYTYDRIGNITKISDSLKTEREDFSYDTLNRLLEAKGTETADNTTLYTRTYQYDPIGNITSASDIGSYLYTHTNPQILTKAGGTDYLYDANGNRLGDTGILYSWNVLNQLSKTLKNDEEIRYSYDHAGKRYLKENLKTNTKLVSIGDTFEKEITDDKTILRRYVFVGNERVATVSDELIGSVELGEGITGEESLLSGVEKTNSLVASIGNLVSSTLLAYGTVTKTPVLNAPFAEGTGTTTKNTVQSGYNGTIGTGASWNTAGKNGNSATFNGCTTAFVNYPSWYGMRTQENRLTFGGWVFHQPFSSYAPRTILYKDKSYNLSLFSNGTISCEIQMKNKTSVDTLSATQVLSSQLNTWRQIYCRYDGAKMSIFVDGTKAAEKTVTGSTLINETDNPVIAGAKNFYDRYGKIFYTNNFFGKLDELKIYTTVLTNAEMVELYHEFDPNYPVPPPPPPPPATEPPASGGTTTGSGSTSGGGSTDKVLTAPYIYYHHPDHLGSSSITTDGNGKVVSDVKYYAYGKTRAESGETASLHKYTGKEFDTETDLYYYGARYYDAKLGRWVSNDPLQRDIAGMVNMGELNGYRYGLNNPMKYVDPTGAIATIARNIDEVGNVTSYTVSTHYVFYGDIANLRQQAAQSVSSIRSIWNDTSNYIDSNDNIVPIIGPFDKPIDFRISYTVSPISSEFFSNNKSLIEQKDLKNNYIELTSKADAINNGYKGFCSTAGRSCVSNTQFGTWFLGTGSDDTVVAHEAGHTFRLADYYNDVEENGKTFSIPVPGYEDTIMASPRATTIVREYIEKIARGEKDRGPNK